MTDEEPDFEAMSTFELLQYDYEMKKHGKGFGTTERLDKWISAIQNSIPFYGIIESVDSLEVDIEKISNQLYELQAQFERLVNALDKQLAPVEVRLKEWIKR